jgi:O-antigen ligase
MKLNKIFLFFSILLGCFPVLTFGMRSVITVLWSISGFIIFFRERREYRFKKDIWLFIIPFLLLIFSLTYSSNLNQGISLLIKMLSFLIFPLIFYLNRDFFTEKQISKIIYFFSIAVFCMIFLQIMHVFLNYNIITDKITLEEIKSNGFRVLSEINKEKISQIKLRRFRSFIIAVSNTHTTYQGLWISFAVFFLCIQFKKTIKRSVKILNVLLIIILVSWLYLISARMPLLALIISSLLTIIFLSNFSNIKLIKFGLVFTIVLIVSVLFKNPFSTRVKEYYTTGLTLLEKSSKTTEFNSSNVRNGIYYCDVELISRSLVFGVGVGDIQDKLNECYGKNISSKIYTWRDYNSHNQYLFFWLSSGIFGFILFSVLLFYCFKKSLKHSIVIYFYFLVLVSLVFFTENLLSRSDGVIFFSFFNSLLFFNVYQKKNTL